MYMEDGKVSKDIFARDFVRTLTAGACLRPIPPCLHFMDILLMACTDLRYYLIDRVLGYNMRCAGVFFRAFVVSNYPWLLWSKSSCLAHDPMPEVCITPKCGCLFDWLSSVLEAAASEHKEVA